MQFSSTFSPPINCDGQKMQDGSRATEDVAHGPELAELGAERPLLADL